MIRADIPESNYGANVQVRIPMPRSAISVTTELVGAGGAGGPAAAALAASGQVRKQVACGLQEYLSRSMIITQIYQNAYVPFFSPSTCRRQSTTLMRSGSYGTSRSSRAPQSKCYASRYAPECEEAPTFLRDLPVFLSFSRPPFTDYLGGRQWEQQQQ
jgi:hypothetical protein